MVEGLLAEGGFAAAWFLGVLPNFRASVESSNLRSLRLRSRFDGVSGWSHCVTGGLSWSERLVLLLDSSGFCFAARGAVSCGLEGCWSLCLPGMPPPSPRWIFSTSALESESERRVVSSGGFWGGAFDGETICGRCCWYRLGGSIDTSIAVMAGEAGARVSKRSTISRAWRARDARIPICSWLLG